jgi:hypothetical protein
VLTNFWYWSTNHHSSFISDSTRVFAKLPSKPGIMMFYSALQISHMHCLHKSSRPRYLIIFVIWDTIFAGVCIGVLTILAIAGVPANCLGMARKNRKSIRRGSVLYYHQKATHNFAIHNPGDALNNPAQGFTTIRFGPGTYRNFGELDMCC